ncbi:MAG: hypothetical protein HKN07_04215 [Acidimicrobiia bacterium]|nr:hypothetical protein [Acidimicrobiia bacterium]
MRFEPLLDVPFVDARCGGEVRDGAWRVEGFATTEAPADVDGQQFELSDGNVDEAVVE